MCQGQGKSEVGDCQDSCRCKPEAETREKADIARIAAEASKRAKIKADVRSRYGADDAKSKKEEAGARIRARD